MASDRSRIGAAGAFHTAAELARRGWEASLTYGNAPRTDIVAQHADQQRLIAVQCKTASGGQAFMLSRTCEAPSPAGRDEWFVLVALGLPDERPSFFVMPRRAVSAYVFISHRVWLSGTKSDGSPRSDSSVRNIERTVAEPYRERWDLMEAGADDAPVILPAFIFQHAGATGLPPRHPGLPDPPRGVDLPEAPRWAATI